MAPAFRTAAGYNGIIRKGTLGQIQGQCTGLPPSIALSILVFSSVEDAAQKLECLLEKC